jgi:hypothetical protein
MVGEPSPGLWGFQRQPRARVALQGQRGSAIRISQPLYPFHQQIDASFQAEKTVPLKPIGMDWQNPTLTGC